MQKQSTSLQFIIGLFFVLIAFVLLGGYFISRALSQNINLYSGIAFFVFGMVMILLSPAKKL